MKFTGRRSTTILRACVRRYHTLWYRCPAGRRAYPFGRFDLCRLDVGPSRHFSCDLHHKLAADGACKVLEVAGDHQEHATPANHAAASMFMLRDTSFAMTGSRSKYSLADAVAEIAAHTASMQISCFTLFLRRTSKFTRYYPPVTVFPTWLRSSPWGAKLRQQQTKAGSNGP